MPAQVAAAGLLQWCLHPHLLAPRPLRMGMGGGNIGAALPWQIATHVTNCFINSRGPLGERGFKGYFAGGLL